MGSVPPPALHARLPRTPGPRRGPALVALLDEHAGARCRPAARTATTCSSWPEPLDQVPAAARARRRPEPRQRLRLDETPQGRLPRTASLAWRCCCSMPVMTAWTSRPAAAARHRQSPRSSWVTARGRSAARASSQATCARRVEPGLEKRSRADRRARRRPPPPARPPRASTGPTAARLGASRSSAGGARRGARCGRPRADRADGCSSRARGVRRSRRGGSLPAERHARPGRPSRARGRRSGRLRRARRRRRTSAAPSAVPTTARASPPSIWQRSPGSARRSSCCSSSAADRTIRDAPPRPRRRPAGPGFDGHSGLLAELLGDLVA